MEYRAYANGSCIGGYDSKQEALRGLGLDSRHAGHTVSAWQIYLREPLPGGGILETRVYPGVGATMRRGGAGPDTIVSEAEADRLRA